MSPSEVESVLRSHASVADAAVVGVPLPQGGEKVVAVVVPAGDAAVDPAELRTWCRERLAAYKMPREIVVRETLPSSMLGKVLRKQVRDELATADQPG